MSRKNFNSAPAHAPAGEYDPAGDNKVEQGAHKDIVGAEIDENGTDNLTAEQLFDKINQELREKRKQAKKEGKSEAEVKALKFDKNSDTYKAWILAFNENQLDLLNKKESEIQAQIEQVEARGEKVSDELFEKWKVVAKKISEVSNAKRARNELSRQNNNATTEIGRLGEHEQQVGVQPALEAKIADLQGESHVVEVQIDALDNLTVGIGDENFDELPTDAVESFETKNGTDMIRTFFSKELDKDEEKGNGDRVVHFNDAVKKYVGSDEVFASLLLKDQNFLKSVHNLFDTKRSTFNNKDEKALVQFIFMLKTARTKYDEIVSKMNVQEQANVNDVGAEIDVPPEIPENLLKISEIEGKIELLKNRSTKTSLWFGGKERKKIAEQIRDLEKELAGMAENLEASAADLLQQAGANSDIETLKAVADEARDLNKNVKSGNLSPGSSRFNKYARVIMAAMAGLTFASSVGEVGGRVNEDQPQAGSTIKLNKSGVISDFGRGGMSGMSEGISDAPNGFTEAINTSEMPAASLLDGGASEPESDTIALVPGKYKLKKPGAKGKEGVEIASVNVGGGEAVVPVAEAVVAPLVASAETAPKKEYTSGELSEQIEQYNGEHNGDFNEKEASLTQKLYEASRTKGAKGISLLEDAKTKFLLLNYTSNSKRKVFQSFIDELQIAKNREKPATPKEGTPSLDEISQKIEKFSADTPNMTQKEIELTDLLYKASKNPGKAGRVLLKQAKDAFNFINASPKINGVFQSLINDISEAQKGVQS